MIDFQSLVELHPKDSSYQCSGYITKKSRSSYSVSRNHIYYCSCRTYEQAFYVRQELNKVDWDKNELPRILEEYPYYYTALLSFYRYISRKKNKSDGKWMLNIPPSKSDNGILQHITYSHIEDALYERDFLIEHDWDYELLIYCIDDRANPYYNLELPPYPERKVRKNITRDTHAKELYKIQELLLENPHMSQVEVAKELGIVDMTIRNWLYNYNTTWNDFKELCLTKEDPFTILKLKPIIYQPDLSVSKGNYKGYVHSNKRSKKNPYEVSYNSKRYGCYPTRKLATKIVRELKKVNWDKKELPRIQRELGFTPLRSKNNIYQLKSGRYNVRKKLNNKTISFGTYDTYDDAVLIRNIMEEKNWDKNELENILKENNITIYKRGIGGVNY